MASAEHDSAVTAQDQTTGETSTTRRTFLSYAAAACAAFIGVVAGIPILGYLLSPLRVKQAATWVDVGRIGDFAGSIPQVVQFTLTRRDGWVEVKAASSCWILATGSGNFFAFNGRCTHLGCAYSWKTDGEYAQKFFCPCHDGVYDREGRVLDGPPPRPLDRLETKVENDRLFVLYQDFQVGVPEKTPL
jgi:menaquinol-cytochrome c reductase iron-sulfur subunit